MKKWLKRAGFGLTVLLVTADVTSLVLNYYWKREYRETVDRLKKEGVLMTPAEVRRRYRENNPERDSMPGDAEKSYPENLPERLDKEVKRWMLDLEWPGFEARGKEEKRAKKVLRKLEPHRDAMQRVFDHRFRREEETITLYSVGFNGRDDGGRKGEHMEEGDIVVHIPLN